MSKDTISDILTCIRNADMAKKETVRIGFTNIVEKIVQILLREGFIKNTREHRENNKSFLVLTLRHRRNRRDRTIFNLKRVSRPGQRIYSKYPKIPRILGGMGIVILSTSLGIITDREARLKRVGGEILCYIW
uniref:Small ribosomal subunit protein uS8c n=1 Tax=Geranium phaeum TaxID=379952 RepID=A0A165TW52_9ROSI|nr:ribosomal protein S8 [Geranium phaeum]